MGIVASWLRNYVVAPKYLGARHDQVITTDDVRIHTVSLDGPSDCGVTVVLVPGFGHWHRHRKVFEMAHALATHANVMVVELRGHGLSAGHSVLGAVESLDVAAAVASVPATQRIVLVGASLGAAASLVYAGTCDAAGLRKPDAVVSISGPGWWTPDQPQRGAARLVRAAGSAVTRGGMHVFMRVRMAHLDGRSWIDPIDVVANIAPSPLLLVHDPDDWYFGAEHVERLAAMGGSNVSMWWRRGGHATDLFAPELYDRIARDVIAPLGSARGCR